VLNLGTISFNPGEDMPYVFYLPSYAATAWYHKVLKDWSDNLSPLLEEVRQFAQTEYAGALMKGSKLGEAEKSAVAKKLSRYTGLSEDYLVKANLRVQFATIHEGIAARPRIDHRPPRRTIFRLELRPARRIRGI
jgi:hypothetical protein